MPRVRQSVRFMIATMSTIALGITGVVYLRLRSAVDPLVDLMGQYANVAEMWELIPVAIVVYLLGVWVWVLVAPAQEERAEGTRRV